MSVNQNIGEKHVSQSQQYAVYREKEMQVVVGCLMLAAPFSF